MSKVLILGSSGRYGRHCFEAFASTGWKVSTFDRGVDSLNEAARNADVIINGWNPPYEKWQQEVPRLTKTIIEAAKVNDARVIVPGNIYVFGEHSASKLDHQTPHLADNPLGRVRIEMEKAYRAAGVKTTIIRAGDFIDTEATGNWLDRIILSKFRKGDFYYPGAVDRSHSWAYLPDLARATVELAEMREQLNVFEDIPFPGYILTGEELFGVFNKMCAESLRLKSFNWLPIAVVAPFWKTGRHLLEMRYLWSKSHKIDDEKFNSLLSDFEQTPVESALKLITTAIA